MSEALIHRLADWLQHEPVVVAAVTATRGATPRKAGSLMLIRHGDGFASIGGGETEARVMAAAETLLNAAASTAALSIELDGRAGAAGVCGGRMQIALRRWMPSERAQASRLSQALRLGRAVELDAALLGHSDAQLRIEPDPRLLIIGGGHCGQALYELAQPLGFELCLFDERTDYSNSARYPQAQTWSGPFASLQAALDTERVVYAVLLSRDFRTDVAALRELSVKEPAFIGMMGSRRRIGEVRRALGDCGLDFDRIRAPIGLSIGAQTPHEIAVSILAELIAFRQGPGLSAS